MSKRLAYLEQVTAAGTADPFPWYALALEYKTLGRIDDAVKTFSTLRDQHADYVPMYLMCGTMLAAIQERRSEARTWLEAGIGAAKAKRDSHALGELESALDSLGD